MTVTFLAAERRQTKAHERREHAHELPQPTTNRRGAEPEGAGSGR
jgi:hypothetical protein